MRAVADVHDVERLVAAGVQLIEVLPRAAYEKAHLPGAVCIPLGELPARSIELDRDSPVVVYCYDMQCDISPRAASLLARLGFSEVWDFAAGKMAWMASGLPVEGTGSSEGRALAQAEAVQTCDLADDLATVEKKLDVYGECVVLDGEGVVLGVLRRTDGDNRSHDTVVLDVMDASPRTVRPSAPWRQVAELFEDGEESSVLVTSLTGHFIGRIRNPGSDG
jgi:rhodanese-related sulfurtransferase